jgi:integron integrase
MNSIESGAQAGSEIGRPRLLQRVHEAIRVRHYSRRTEEAYVHWIKRLIYFHGKRHPEAMGEAEVTAFLNHLAVDRHVAAATQNQALSAILFLYRQVLGRELPWLDGVQRPTRPPRVPVVLTRAEVERLLAGMTGTRWLIASLLYGAGLRVMEGLRLRVKDVDLSYRQVLVRDGKGEKDRVTMLPEKLVAPMRGHLERVRLLHARDLREGYGEVHLPYALARKYPRAGREWHWQYVLPSRHRSADPEDGVVRRHHLYDSVPQRAIKEAARGGHRQAGELPHAAPLVCHAPAGGWLGHSHGAGAARPLGRVDHDDLHPRAQPRRARGAEPARPLSALTARRRAARCAASRSPGRSPGSGARW